MHDGAVTPASDTHRVRSRRGGHGSIVGLLAGPALALIVLFLIGPLTCIVLLSLTDYQFGAATLRFVGLGNYTEMFADPVFRKSLTNTLIYVGVVVPVSVLLGLGAALLIEADRSLRGVLSRRLFPAGDGDAHRDGDRVGVHAPSAIRRGKPCSLKSIGLGRYDLLQNRTLVLFTLCGIGIWQSVGFNMVLFMAGLTAIPRDLYEAAAVDGASTRLERFRLVTWPMLGPVTLFVVVITAIRSFQVFDTVQVLTDGGPNKASEVLLYTMYSEGFEYLPQRLCVGCDGGVPALRLGAVGLQGVRARRAGALRMSGGRLGPIARVLRHLVLMTRRDRHARTVRRGW